jgi:methyltransferase (TIGR00027 family)
MKSGTASRTAEFMALFRALETVRRPPSARLFSDPYARRFLRPALRAVVASAEVSAVHRGVSRFIERRWPGAMTSAVARTRLIDDAVLDALAAGVPQLVILGAGFDCRAHRLDGARAARIFEIDHPATQAAKRGRLGDAGRAVVYVPVDFDRDDLASALRAAGFDRRERSFFVWEGVTNYLTAAAVDATVRTIVDDAPAGSALLFTYVHRGVLDGSTRFFGTERLAATLARTDESWTFGLDPETVGAWLAARGLDLVEDLGAREYRRRYLAGASDAMRGYEFYHAALARVGAGR